MLATEALRRVAASSRSSIGVVEPSQDRTRNDCGVRVGRSGGSNRRGLAKALMRTLGVEVTNVLEEYLLEVSLPREENVIEALPASTAKEAFAQRIRRRSLNGRADDANPNTLRHPSEEAAELAVPVPDQKLRRFSEGSGVSNLLGNPAISGRTSHAEVDDAPGGVFDGEEREQGTEPRVVELEEVAGQNPFGLLTQERCRPRS